MRHLPQVLEYVGLLSIVIGCYAVAPWLAALVGGLMAVGLAQVLQMRREDTHDDTPR